MISLTEFLLKYNGKYCEVAGSANAQNQCVDLANAFIREVLGLPIIEWTNAKDFPSKAGDKYTYHANTPQAIPQEGDLMVWDNGTAGHIAIYLNGNVNNFNSFDQNYPLGSPCHVQGHTYANVSGWLRCNGIIETNMNDQTIIDLGSPWNKMELQAIRSKMNDMSRDLDNLKQQAEVSNSVYEEMQKKYNELLEKPQEGGLSAEQIMALGDVLKDATKTQLELTNKKIQAVQTSVDLTEANLTGDREGLGTMQVNQASMLTEMREFKTLLTGQTKKINEGVQATVEKAITSIADRIKESVKSALDSFTNEDPIIRKKTVWERIAFWN